jgi:hypothetical protein
MAEREDKSRGGVTIQNVHKPIGLETMSSLTHLSFLGHTGPEDGKLTAGKIGLPSGEAG